MKDTPLKTKLLIKAIVKALAQVGLTVLFVYLAKLISDLLIKSGMDVSNIFVVVFCTLIFIAFVILEYRYYVFKESLKKKDPP